MWRAIYAGPYLEEEGPGEGIDQAPADLAHPSTRAWQMLLAASSNAFITLCSSGQGLRVGADTAGSRTSRGSAHHVPPVLVSVLVPTTTCHDVANIVSEALPGFEAVLHAPLDAPLGSGRDRGDGDEAGELARE